MKIMYHLQKKNFNPFRTTAARCPFFNKTEDTKHLPTSMGKCGLVPSEYLFCYKKKLCRLDFLR